MTKLCRLLLLYRTSNPCPKIIVSPLHLLGFIIHRCRVLVFQLLAQIIHFPYHLQIYPDSLQDLIPTDCCSNYSTCGTQVPKLLAVILLHYRNA